MPGIRELARMLIRLFAALYLVVGISAFVGIVIVAELSYVIPNQGFHDFSVSVIGYAAYYGAVSFIGGIGLWLTSGIIARFASK